MSEHPEHHWDNGELMQRVHVAIEEAKWAAHEYEEMEPDTIPVPVQVPKPLRRTGH
ncbi:hypothetical protein [Actinokineospora enzanensis]|uniref:hypothetical protein n=1 Tax=Actinokineospora enzanensis TaxID=155975 RepID=UPI0003694F8B|nr:hypothetical protein [Actinokineospora enzanensis]